MKCSGPTCVSTPACAGAAAFKTQEFGGWLGIRPNPCENSARFTGIITGVGRIIAVDAAGTSSSHGKRLTVQCPAGYLDDVGAGDSIALNGACMTVTTFDAASGQFHVDVSAESLARTAGLGACGAINLAKALRANDRLGGHLVSGHVDGIGTVTVFEATGECWTLRIDVPPSMGPNFRRDDEDIRMSIHASAASLDPEPSSG